MDALAALPPKVICVRSTYVYNEIRDTIAINETVSLHLVKTESPIRQRVNLLIVSVTRARDESIVFNKYRRITAVAHRFIKVADEFIRVGKSRAREAACEFNTFDLVPRVFRHFINNSAR